jgi:hypothetical protein
MIRWKAAEVRAAIANTALIKITTDEVARVSDT